MRATIGVLIKSWFLLLAIAILTFPQPGSTLIFSEDDFFEKGQEFRRAKDFEKAFKTWWQGSIELEKQEKSDLRIGIAFIELATEVNAESYFGTACKMYFSCFSQLDTSAYIDIAREELARVSPLMSTDQRKLLEQALEKNPHDFGKELKRFWQEKDPNLETPGNERLIEHWQRIAYARKNFNKNKRAPYDADDRARIYVKYGKPDRRKTGHFGTSYRGLLELGFNMSKRAKLQFYDEHPEYDIWIYDELGTDESVIFMFGNYKGTGSFGLRIGVEEFISDRAFSYSAESFFGSPRPGYFLQYIYYTELEFLGDFFDYRKTNLRFAWESRGYRALKLRLRSEKMSNEIVDRTHPIYKYAKPDASDYDRRFNTIKITPKIFRFLSETNERMNILYAVASYQIDPQKITRHSGRFELPNYEIRYSLTVQDQNFIRLDKISGTRLSGIPNATIFFIKHSPEVDSYAISARAISYEVQKEKIHGLGQSTLRLPFPLKTEEKELEVSDIVLGYLSEDIVLPGNFPFPFIPNRRFRKDEPLQIYLEVYHLQPDIDKAYHFTLDFIVLKIDKKGRVKKKNQIVQIFPFTSKSSDSREHFGIDISSLKKGNYQVYMKIKDTVSGAEKLRTAKFEVMKN